VQRLAGQRLTSAADGQARSWRFKGGHPALGLAHSISFGAESGIMLDRRHLSAAFPIPEARGWMKDLSSRTHAALPFSAYYG